MRSLTALLHAMLTVAIAFLALGVALAKSVPARIGAMGRRAAELARVRAEALYRGSALARMSGDTLAAGTLGGLGTAIVAILAAVIIPIVIIQLLAQVLPDYFTALGDIFAAFDAVNTTGWPAIVALVFTFAPLVLGVVAIAGVFALGTLLVISISRR